MENVIAGLLRDFEDGKMTRRQLIQSLAMAAMAAPAAAAAAQAPATSSAASTPAPWKTVWLDHISYQVSDYKRSVEFYKNLMGWEVQNDTGTRQRRSRSATSAASSSATAVSQQRIHSRPH